MNSIIVGKNQTFYIGGRRFVEGDVIPSSLNSGIEIIKKDKIEPELKQEEHKRIYRPRQRKDLFGEND